jgi:UDP-N-acetyl-D-glucosamine dehydrogenase
VADATMGMIDRFGILDDITIQRYFALGCQVKGLGWGHVKRIKDQVREEREQMYLQQMGGEPG